MQHTRGKVPIFTLRPHPGVSLVLILTMTVGLLVALSFFSKEEGTGVYRQKGIATLILTVLTSTFLLIVATAKMWFTHLWKKNSTHERHKNHTKYHPSVKEREFRERH